MRPPRGPRAGRSRSRWGRWGRTPAPIDAGAAAGVLEMQAREHDAVHVAGVEPLSAQFREQLARREAELVPLLLGALGADARVDEEVPLADADEQAVQAQFNAVPPVRRHPVLPLALGHLPEEHAAVETDGAVRQEAQFGFSGHRQARLAQKRRGSGAIAPRSRATARLVYSLGARGERRACNAGDFRERPPVCQ